MNSSRQAKTPQWALSLESSFVWLVAVGVAILAVITLFEPVSIWFEQRSRIAELQQQVTSDTEALAEIRANIERWSDPAYIEAQARQRLLYVYPGDISYLIVNDVTVDEIDRTVAPKTVGATEINWVDALVGSYAAAAVGEN
ncbi:MAG: hypothetical protein RL431_432 [Actinomycetota bacterium]